ncbi:MAG: uroporphyrinogen-III C-methyltransferase [Clostridia bacterium]|nr:uroporphyrinogen-III C-methyltransferase [Clostridia bacterium]
MVYLVGAGPGDCGLITQKGLECIKNAEVIVYDHLANPTLLNHANENCLLIYAGKIAGNHHMVQEKINDTLVKYGKTQNVVRLKGGDPFIFGRGGEEVTALVKNYIPYEIVPGVSSCYGAAEYCGIPVTHRGVATSFHVITGHEKSGSETVDYSALAKLKGTLVFLMGLAFAQNISARLIENGKAETTPAAIISSGTTENQKCVTGTLKDIPEMAKKMSSPAIILVGDVVNLQHDWFKPTDKKILTTGTKSMNAQIRKAAGKTAVTEISLIKTVPINFELFCKTDLTHFSHIVFISANGVDIFFDYMNRSETDIRTLRDTKFAVVGKKTALALKEKGIFADIIPRIHSGSKLAKLLCGADCENILLIRAENGSDIIPDILSENNISFTDLKLYRTETDFSKQELLNLCVPETDYIILSSGSAAKAFSQMSECKTNAKFISIGNETTKAAQSCGIEIYKTAENATAEGIIECIRRDTK